MKTTFILPGIGKKPGERYIGTWKMEPLMIAMLKAVTPPEIQTEFFDDRLELIDYDTETDAVALTVKLYGAKGLPDSGEVPAEESPSSWAATTLPCFLTRLWNMRTPSLPATPRLCGLAY